MKKNILLTRKMAESGGRRGRKQQQAKQVTSVEVTITKQRLLSYIWF